MRPKNVNLIKLLTKRYYTKAVFANQIKLEVNAIDR